eukprot:scaffold4784_cov388-Prasinococcus_capsulatus_cf.AAC.2
MDGMMVDHCAGGVRGGSALAAVAAGARAQPGARRARRVSGSTTGAGRARGGRRSGAAGSGGLNDTRATTIVLPEHGWLPAARDSKCAAGG